VQARHSLWPGSRSHGAGADDCAPARARTEGDTDSVSHRAPARSHPGIPARTLARLVPHLKSGARGLRSIAGRPTSRFRRSAERHAVRIECTTFGAWLRARPWPAPRHFPRRHAPHHQPRPDHAMQLRPCISSPAPAVALPSPLSTWALTLRAQLLLFGGRSLIDRNLTTQTADVWHRESEVRSWTLAARQ